MDGRKKKQILIAEDEIHNYEFLHRIINKRFGYDTFWAHDGVEALETLETKNVDALILDINMPIMDGMETLRIIRKNPSLDELPIMICSGFSEEKMVKEILSMHVINYIIKPIGYMKAVESLTIFFDSMDKNKTSDDDSIKILTSFSDKQLCPRFEKEIKKDFNLICSHSGTDALKKFIIEKPQIVILGEHQGIIDSLALAVKFKSLHSESNKGKVYRNYKELTLIYFGDKLPDQAESIFNHKVNSFQDLYSLVENCAIIENQRHNLV